MFKCIELFVSIMIIVCLDDSVRGCLLTQLQQIYIISKEQMNNLKMMPFIMLDIESGKSNRRQPRIPKTLIPPYTETTLDHQEIPSNKTEQVRTAHNIGPPEEEEKAKTALKLPQIHKKASETFEEKEDIPDKKENENQAEETRIYSNPILKKYADRKSTDKIKTDDASNFLNIVGVKPTVRSTSKMSSKEANRSLGHDRFERALLREKNKEENKERESSPLELKNKRRRVSTNCKSTTSQKIETSSRPKRSVPLAISEKKKSPLVLRIDKPKSSPNYYEWCLLIGLLDAVVSEKQSGPTYKAYVGKGNNSILVKSIIKARPWWTLCQEESQAQLVWTQSKSQKMIDNLKQGAVLHPFQWDKQIKARMTIFGNTETLLNDKIKDNISIGFHKVLTPSERTILCKSHTTIHLVHPLQVRTIEAGKQRIHNHLQFHWNLTNKKALYYNMKAYYLAIDKDPFENIPETYHVQKQGDDEWNRFANKYQKKSYWIIKPGENSNQGCGIDVVETLEEAREIVRNKSTRANGKPRSHIIQRYLLPFLYNKRKFDIRCYIVATVLNGNLRVYWYEQGYIRTASKEFTIKNLKNRMIHLTNDAVQKHSQAYGKHQNANKLSFTEFHKYVKNTRPDHDFFEECYPRMIQLTIDAARATNLVIDSKHREFSFEVFGLDFMIDENFNTWLIEVNTNPCLELACPLLARLIPSMLQNAFRLAVDPIFPPPKDHPKHKGLAQDLFETNKFNLIFSSKEEADLSRVLQPNKLQDIIQSDDESQCGDLCDLKDE